MTTEELLSKLRAEVERLKKSYDVYLARVTKEDFLNDLDNILSFLDSLESEKPVPADLEEAAKECNSNLQLQEYFIKGGIWQKEQMMKEAAEAEISVKFPVVGRSLISVIDMPKEFKYGDKVRIIIVKGD